MAEADNASKPMEFILWVILPIVLFAIATFFAVNEYAANIAMVNRGWMRVAAFVILAVVPTINLVMIWRNEGVGSKWLTVAAWVIALVLILVSCATDLVAPGSWQMQPGLFIPNLF